VGLEQGGSVQAAAAWLGLILGERNLDAAWPATDPNMRLAIAQGWLFKRGEATDTRDELARSLAEAPSSAELWPTFSNGVLDAFADNWPFFDYEGYWGVIDMPEPIAVDGLELVCFAMIEGAPPGVIEVEAGEPWAVLPLLMRSTGEGWLVAGVSQSGPPMPGWPPTWPTGPKPDDLGDVGPAP
jgi:hypothetical protein